MQTQIISLKKQALLPTKPYSHSQLPNLALYSVSTYSFFCFKTKVSDEIFLGFLVISYFNLWYCKFTICLVVNSVHNRCGICFPCEVKGVYSGSGSCEGYPYYLCDLYYKIVELPLKLQFLTLGKCFSYNGFFPQLDCGPSTAVPSAFSHVAHVHGPGIR